MAVDADYGVVPNVNPHFAFEQMLLSPLGSRLCNETAVRPDLLLAKQLQSVICGGDGTAVTLLTGCHFDIAGD